MLLLSPFILFGLLLESSKTFRKVVVIVVPFLFIKGATHGYFEKLSMEHNKHQIHLLYFIRCICARFEPITLSLKEKCNLCFQIFLIIRFQILFLIVGYQKLHQNNSCSFVSSRLFIKKLSITDTKPRGYPPYFRFLAVVNVLSEAVLLCKSLKSPWAI